tara:strand:+ start:411 stop:656 length:246 start_codon:yes stop_codon:yes gene_type:complete
MDLNIERKNSYITSTEYFDGGGRMSCNLYYLIKSRNEIRSCINNHNYKWVEGEFQEIYDFFEVVGIYGLEELYQREMIKNN